MESIKESLKSRGVGIVALSVVFFSLLFFLAAGRFSGQGSFVEVKGLSERIVKADTAIWSMNFEVKSNDVDALYSQVEKNISTVKSFLKEKGFEESEVNVAPVNVYQDTYREALFRYNSNTQLSLYTKKVDLVKVASKDTLALAKKGIVMSQNYISF
ncbi:MAG: SIMPL domain-containing protein, partial [Patescibacteria group bacterium]